MAPNTHRFLTGSARHLPGPLRPLSVRGAHPPHRLSAQTRRKNPPAAPRPPACTRPSLSETLLAHAPTLIHHHQHPHPTPTWSTFSDCRRRSTALPEQQNHYPDPDLEPYCANGDEEDESSADDQLPKSLAAVADEENKDDDHLLAAVLDAADQESPCAPDKPCTPRVVPCLKDETSATMPLCSEVPEGRRALHIWSGNGVDLESVWTVVCRRHH